MLLLEILIFKTPVQFDTKTFRVIPVCVPTLSRSFQGKNSYATGWG